MHPLADTGRVIAGRYRLEAPIGRGAMGVVWRARDQLLDRDVAVKEVHMAETLTDEERANAYQRTLREAKTAARLNHPGVVTVYDVAEDEGRPWIVMQLVNAKSLDQVLADSGPLPPRQAAEMGRQLLSALTVAHGAGVMHRDVKPSNVLLSNDGRAVLTDFGIATFQGDPKLTQTGMVMGSPGFTAPERIRGEDASPASDLWSLGATIFAAVEGKGPYEQRGGAITTMSAIINEDAPEPARAGALGPVITALLRREPSQRPDTARAQQMITDALPQLAERPPGGSGGYVPTAISASPSSRRPVPGDIPPQTGAGGQPAGREPLGAGTGIPAGYGAGAGTGSRTGEAPPDFSSWYDPSPRTGTSAGRPGSTYPPPAGYGPPAGGYGAQPGSQAGYGSQQWAGSAPPRAGSSAQQTPGLPPRSGDRSGYGPAPRRKSGLWWKITIVVLVLIGAGAGAAAVVLLRQNHNTASSGQAGGSPSSPTATGSPAQIVDAINQQSSGAPPAGYTTYSVPKGSNEQSGFRLAAPSDWKASTSGYQTYFRDPSTSDTNLLVDLTPHTYPSDMLKEADYIKARSIAKFPGYHQLGLARTTVRGQPGAYWKFTWDNDGVEQEVLDLLYVAPTSGGNQSFALYMTAPASSWNTMRPVFDEEMRSFTPTGS
jgi:serine/threonine protein kinase